MQNKVEYEIDKELTVADCYGYPATLICSKETLNLLSADLFTHNWTSKDTYKGHPLIIDNSLKLNEFKILRKGEKYNAE